jgi:DNA-directed RNA polymerase sigma subunit (sigma70/sigma32)
VRGHGQVSKLVDPDVYRVASVSVEGPALELEPRDALILYWRFLKDGEKLTLSEVGTRLMMSREEVRQIEMRILREYRTWASQFVWED